MCQLFILYYTSNDKLDINGTIITAVSAGTTTLSINDGTKTYNIKFYVRDYVGDSLTQELCDHDHTHFCEEVEVCSYCGKQIVRVYSEYRAVYTEDGKFVSFDLFMNEAIVPVNGYSVKFELNEIFEPYTESVRI